MKIEFSVERIDIPYLIIVKLVFCNSMSKCVINKLIGLVGFEIAKFFERTYVDAFVMVMGVNKNGLYGEVVG
ncbi:hypothetical protein SDC9_138880 [bioreactor metagenome]|uniref:Uncharacterized protein n=1 Tax=bioreactor metagenome TaxID=1076179 RepID=A0A645DR11_9ZZZZ